MICTIYAPSERPQIEFLLDALEDTFEVFFAPTGVQAGSEEWKNKIISDMAQCRVAIVYITETSLSDDSVVWRIEQALDRQLNIIPIIGEEHDFRSLEHLLVGDVIRLKQYNAISLANGHEDVVVDRLVNRFLGDVPQKRRKVLCFISYSRQDTEFAARITQDLRGNRIEVWRDQDSIPAGANWDREIEKAINDCSHVIFIATPSSVASENVQDEISLAVNREKTVIPLMLETCDLPLRVHRAQWVDFRNNYKRAFAQLIINLGLESRTRLPADIPIDEDGRRRFEYNGHRIEANEVPEIQWDFDFGFGWAFRITAIKTGSISRVILKSMRGERTSENKGIAFNQGLEIVTSCIDNGTLLTEQCFLWEPGDISPKPVNCDDISPGGFRSPVR